MVFLNVRTVMERMARPTTRENILLTGHYGCCKMKQRDKITEYLNFKEVNDGCHQYV
jgi:hypothetical protein